MGVRCEVCGNEQIIKHNGNFSCARCGIQYSLEDIQKMVFSSQFGMPFLSSDESLFEVVGTIKRYNTPYPKRTDIVIPSIINGCNITTIGKLSFGYAHNSEDEDSPAPGDDLLKITIEEGIKVIDENAFRDLLYLEEVTLPDSIQDIKSGAFKNCNKLQTVRFMKMDINKTKHIDTFAFDGCKKLERFIVEYRSGKVTTIPKSTGYVTI